ncbi:unnamed protein product [Trichogramma brassicae]|uniref:C2H2-type domain-containing protein n=1 Tax=Trichogramma brassicae TaxID=86971 RepID=A0A6H5J3K5_9HYME|nr:unnamed protein product [Trichogramma brassicae]
MKMMQKKKKKEKVRARRLWQTRNGYIGRCLVLCPRAPIARVLRENDVNSELYDEIKVEIECVDMKPGMNLLKVTKVEDISSNHLRDMNDRQDYQIQKKIKREPADGVKEEVDVNYELSDARDIRETTFTRNSHLNCHDKSAPHGTVYACARESNLKKNMDKTRNGISHACDICGKIYSQKRTLRAHMDSVHHKITHVCDICGKSFTQKFNLRTHVNGVHKGVKHTCDICGKSFTQKSNLQAHIDELICSINMETIGAFRLKRRAIYSISKSRGRLTNLLYKFYVIRPSVVKKGDLDEWLSRAAPSLRISFVWQLSKSKSDKLDTETTKTRGSLGRDSIDELVVTKRAARVSVQLREKLLPMLRECSFDVVSVVHRELCGHETQPQQQQRRRRQQRGHEAILFIHCARVYVISSCARNMMYMQLRAAARPAHRSRSRARA